jgi:hypothetical protein
MSKLPEHGWSEPRVAGFFEAHPERTPRIPSYVPQGWDEVVADALVQLLAVERATGTETRVTQIKEKFGGLRIYVDVEEDSAGPLEVVRETPASTFFRSSATPGSVRERVHAIVDQAAARAELCCVRCGAPSNRTDGYYRYCASHQRARKS